MTLHEKINLPPGSHFVLLIIFLFPFGSILSQTVHSNNLPKHKHAVTHCSYRAGNTIIHLFNGVCKDFTVTRVVIPDTIEAFLKIEKQNPILYEAPPAHSHTPLLSIHGNVQYSFLHQSYVDTPFSQRNFEQHTVQTFLSVVIKDRYPLKVNLTNRISNSAWFTNFFDVNMRFDQAAFARNVKQRLLYKIENRLQHTPELSLLNASLEQELNKYNRLKNWLSDDAVLQQIVEEREREMFKHTTTNGQDDLSAIQLPGNKWKFKTGSVVNKISTPAPSKDSAYERYVNHKKAELDSLQQKIQTLQARADSIKSSISNRLAVVKEKINKTTNLKELRSIESENNADDHSQKGIDNFLSNLKSIGIGRSIINYSELTANNVSLTGLNMEYNNRFYAAFAAGKIDYGFRDFMGKNTRQKGQNFFMARAGIGDIEQKAIILSAFTGRKYNYGSVFADTVTEFVQVTGYALEAILKKDENTGISAEIAKTTKPVFGSFKNNQSMKSLFQFSDNANLGINIKGQTAVQKTGTRLSGTYRKTGEYFQSFSLFTYNTNQTAWTIKMEQPFWRNKASLTAMLRQNDFINPFSEKTFKTSTVFKSLQLQVRLPKWPVLSAGYFPGSQLYIINKERIRENVYYILNGSVVHHYTIGSVHMLSSAIYNRYANKGTDSGFVTYNGTSYIASQTVMFRQWQLQGAWMYTNQEQMQFYTLDVNGEYALLSCLRLGGGVKYNKVAGARSYLGSTAGVDVTLKKLGGLQLQYEKSYLPTIWQTLYPVEVGRLLWYKNF